MEEQPGFVPKHRRFGKRKNAARSSSVAASATLSATAAVAAQRLRQEPSCLDKHLKRKNRNHSCPPVMNGPPTAAPSLRHATVWPALQAQDEEFRVIFAALSAARSEGRRLRVLQQTPTVPEDKEVCAETPVKAPALSDLVDMIESSLAEDREVHVVSPDEKGDQTTNDDKPSFVETVEKKDFGDKKRPPRSFFYLWLLVVALLGAAAGSMCRPAPQQQLRNKRKTAHISTTLAAAKTTEERGAGSGVVPSGYVSWDDMTKQEKQQDGGKTKKNVAGVVVVSWQDINALGIKEEAASARLEKSAAEAMHVFPMMG